MNTPFTGQRCLAYVGSRTTRERNARGEGITVYRVETVTGNLERVQVVDDLVNPSFLALNAKGDRLYSVHGDGNEVSVFSVHAVDGTLAFLQRQDCGGRNPVHLALAPDGRHLVVSDHLGNGGGAVVVLPVREDGTLGEVTQRVSLPGAPGPHRKEQPHAKPHFNPFDPSGRFVLVPDKGLDRVFSFTFRAGTLVPAAQPWIETREGAGPRNAVFHPVRSWAYIVNELDSTLLACGFSPATGALTPLQQVSSLPDTYTGNSRAGSVQIDPSGRWLYVSNRGHDSIGCYAIDPASGRLSVVQHVASGGRTPRFFTLNPDGRLLYALNEDSDTIACFSVSAEDGHLAPSGTSVACGSPVCMIFGAAL